MNNRDVVAALEECRQAAASGPVEPTDEVKEGFQRCRASLSAELSMLLQDAATMKWPFVPEKWQYKQSVTSEDKTNLKELISQHLPHLLRFLRASLMAGEPLWAVSVVFLVDRFLYWVDASKSLLKIVEALHKHYPATPVAPQVVIRQARVALNSGKLQKAEYILSSLINNRGATGCWVYQADSDRALVQAVSVQVRGQVLQKLGLWIEAAELIWASLIGLHALPEPDKKGIGTSLGLLANILVSMNDADFRAFTTNAHVDQCFLKERGHRLLAAAEAAKMAVVYSQYDSLYVLSNVVTQGTCLLAYSFSAGCPTAERGTFLTKAKDAFQIALLTKREGEVVTSKQELHTFVKAAYSLTVTHKWLGSIPILVSKASQECQKAVEKLYAYSAIDGRERGTLAAEIMCLVAEVKALLGVAPFSTSNERSFVPDVYRAAGETPMRFSLDCFFKVMDRFRKHHASVCMAHKTSCEGTPLSGDQCLSEACITAMRTTTETMDTDNPGHFRNTNMPLGRRREGQTVEGSVDLQCATEVSDEKEMMGGTSSAGLRLKVMSKVRTSSSAFRDSLYSVLDTEAISCKKDAITLSEWRVETSVDQQCLTDVSDKDGQNICIENASLGSLAGCTGKTLSTYRERQSTSSRGTPTSASSWESVFSPETGSKTDPDHKEASDSVQGITSKGMGLDLQCATEVSDEEEMKGGTSSAVFKGVKTFSSSLSDSLGSNSSWQKLSLSDTGSLLSCRKDTGSPATQTGWVDLLCPTAINDEKVLDGAGHRVKEMSTVRTYSSSLGDSLGSDSSWQKLSLSDAGSPVSSGKDASFPVKPRAKMGVDPQCLTQGSDNQNNMKGSASSSSPPARTKKLECSVTKLRPQPPGLTSPASILSPGSKDSRLWSRSEENLSFLLVELPGSDSISAALRTDAPAGTPETDVALGQDSHLPEPYEVDPLAETEDYLFEDLGMPAASAHKNTGRGLAITCSKYKESSVPAAEVGGMGDPSERRHLWLMGNEEGHKEADMGDDQYLFNSNQAHNQCLSNCMLGSEVPEQSPTLMEQDYKALMSGVCHSCLLNRLNIKKTFKLRKHRSAYSALLLKYSKMSDRWTSRETKVYIGDPTGKHGCQRTAFWVQFLHQEETLGRYIGKTYRFEKAIHYHLNDVERQMAAQYYVTEFNKRLYDKNIPAQIFFIPSEVLLILDGDVIEDCVTVEPYMLGDFVKLTNNTTYTNPYYGATEYGIAFGHFTYQLSGGTEVVVDLQGWVTGNGKGLTYLTDPQLHTVRKPGSNTRHGKQGIKQFLESQHGPQCNDICRLLSLGKLQ